MEYLEHQNIGVEKIKINELLKKLDSVGFDMH